mmetsp:Transcript_15071/g.32673  ORF Transcript_15071/g.32673 Transcript_15071/m.32673 type:complete len:158 (-) Transcript_15071:722-1195(-)|eukprot:CAMPEP_0202904234 /NCGR_PEP_ID=MMETSP1392-20130828/28416_1 /ASSEMBLY_ACC=CAM_ASM_000868 /TAXON_ID=225041 /ORGANISM="Chlamydomonas chlamydogama, Strain SAG 11-48b" /LENGTH=157 /DNA_ID=CAMNT_0049591765 /DNA_START=15 /DNA_END=488 /DNA_ORIENTATION=+
MDHSSELKRSAEDLIALLQKSEATLDHVSRKLEEEFAHRFKDSKVDPMSLAKRLKRLADEVPALKAECQTLLQRKQALIDAAKRQLLSNRTTVQQLCARAGVPVEDDSSTFEGFTDVISQWDCQVARQKSGLLSEQPSYLSRDELNRELAKTMLTRG